MLNKLKKILFFTLILPSLTVLADNDVVLEATPTLNAKFITTQCAKPCKKMVKQARWIMRDQNQVEIRALKLQDELEDHSEIWRFNPVTEKMSYLFLMHDEKKAIEYFHEDMKLLEMSPSKQKWQEVSSLISGQELALLKKSAKKSKKHFGKTTEIYTGKLNGAKVHLVWMPELNIPYQLIYDYPKATVKITMQSLINLVENKNQAILPHSNDALISSYSQIDFTDIGDIEQNPEDKVWLKKAHGAPGLGAHQH